MIASKIESKYEEKLSPFHKTKICKNGDWYNDKIESALYLCINGDDSSDTYGYDSLDINAIKCVKTCTALPEGCIKEDRIRKWSISSDWMYNGKNIKT